MSRAESASRESGLSLRALALGLRAGRGVAAASIAFAAYAWWRAPALPRPTVDLSNCNAVWSDEEPVKPQCPDIDREYRESLRQEEISFDEARRLLADVPSEELLGASHFIDGSSYRAMGSNVTFTVGPVEFSGIASGPDYSNDEHVTARHFAFECDTGRRPERDDRGRVWRSDRLGVYAFECAPVPGYVSDSSAGRGSRLGVRVTPAPVVMPSDVASKREERARWWRALVLFVAGVVCGLGALAAGFGRWGLPALGLAGLRWRRGQYDGSESIELEDGSRVTVSVDARSVFGTGRVKGSVARGGVYVACEAEAVKGAAPYREAQESARWLVGEGDYRRWRSGLVKRVSGAGVLGVAAVAATWVALRVWLG